MDGPRALPVWLLDVDGVLNVPSPRWGAPARHGRLVTQYGLAFDLFWADEVVAFVRHIHEEGLAEVRWATTWVGWTHLLEQLWHLPSLPVAFPVDVPSANKAKLPSALGVVERERRPLVWTDDERIPPSGPHRDRLTGAGQPTLLVSPDPVRGLRPCDVERIEALLRVWSLDDRDPLLSPQVEYAERVAACVQAFGEHDPATWEAWRALADYYEQIGSPERATRAREQLVWSVRRCRGSDALDTLLEQYALASNLLLSGEHDRAISLLTDTVTRCRRVLDPDDWLALAAHDSLTDLTRDLA